MADEIEARLDCLIDLFRRRIADDLLSEKALDALHAELEDARRWRELALLKPLMRELIAMLDRMDALLAALPNEELVRIRDDLLEILVRRAVEPISVDAAGLDPALHEVVAVEETAEPPRDTQVLSVVQRGYTIEGSVLRRAGVVVARARPGSS